MDSKYSWTSEKIVGLIEARSKYKIDCNSTPDYVYQQIINELGLQNQASIEDTAKLWESLITKYKELSQPALEPEDAAPPSWEFFECMHEAMLSLPPSILEIEAPQITLQDDHREETVEEEAARLEEVFRNGNIVDIQSVVHDVEDEDEKEVIVEEFLSDEDEEDCEEDEEEPAEGCKEDNHQQENAIVDDIWSVEKVLELIALRGQKEAEVISLGHRPVFGQMLEQLGLVDVSTPSEARKKWSSLVRKYFQLKTKSPKTSQNASSENGLKTEANTWPFYEAMENVMQEIIKTSPDGGMKSRKSPEFLWSLDITKKFIRLRMEKQSEISLKGHNAVYQDILNKLGISDKVSVMMARKKWNYLFKRYQDEEMAGGERSWALMKEMRQVMKPFRTSNTAKLKSRASPEFLWPNDLTRRFIELRASMHGQFIEGGIQNTYTEIMEELGLEHILTPNQLRKKWNYLVAKCKELSCTTGPDGSVPAPHSWPFFDDMQKALQTIPEHLINSSKIVRVNFENIWTKEVVLKFIELKGAKSAKSTKKISSIFSEIIEELGLTNQLSPHHARKKWNYLYNKYLDLSNPDVDEYVRHSWPFYSVMQVAVAAHPASYTFHRSAIDYFVEAGGEDEDIEGSCSRRTRSYVCFLCGKAGKFLNEFFMFEQNQRLLHTQKNALEIVSHLVGKKVVNLGMMTCLCSRCTNIVNEADSLIFRHDRIREEAQQLFFNSTASDKADKEVEDPQQLISSGDLEEKEEEEKVKENEEEPVKEEQKITYSKRGRKRKSTIRSDSIRTSIKTEPLDEVFESTECEVDFDDDSEDDRKRRKLRARGRGVRGRGRGKRKRGRPATRTTLIGRGLGGQYPNSNKRKTLPFKGPKIYHCSECKGEFKKYTELMNHRKNVHTVIDTSTLEVEETVLESGVITYFNKGKANNSDTSHMCRDCDKLFLRKDDLWYHQEIAHTEGKGRAKTAFKDRSYDCEECGEKFLFKYKLKMHINSKHLNDAGQSANDFTCGECGCKLGSLPGLTFHMRKHHNKSLTYRKTTEYLCSDCGFMASSNKKLKEHQESHCGSSTKPKVQCEVCGKTVLKVSLKMHKVKMHSDFKEQCDRCGERYATKTDLLRHINVVHLHILLYNCRYCGERFPTSDALRYHRVKFHEKPSFFCQVCGKCYKRVGELNTHIKRAHSDRRKAEACQYCGKEYYDRSGLRNHLVNKHSVPQEMTYSENYLRKKRVDGLPLAKHMERRGLIENKAISPMNQSSILQQQLQTVPQQQIHHHQQQEPPQHQQSHQPVNGHTVFPEGVVGQHPHLRVVDEAAEAARNLSAYHEMNAPEEESSLVVTEITESPQVEQTVLVDPLNVPQGLMHHPQVAHMQPPMAMHHHMHHQMQHHANMRLNVLYQMNMHQPGPSHLNM